MKSRYDRIAEARDLAEQFIKAADEAIRTAEFRNYNDGIVDKDGMTGWWHIKPRENATVKRRSMDLTHALAEVRKP